MAGPDRTESNSVAFLQALEDEPYRHGFFATLRRLESLYADRPRLGTSRKAADDPLRLAQEPTLIFAPATLAKFERSSAAGVPRLSVYFFGLLGANGPLPHHLTEYARDRERNSSDPTFHRFLDVFHHRLLCLFYRAWADAQPTTSLDRPGADRFGRYVASLFGLGMKSLEGRNSVPDGAKRHYAARLGLQTRNAEGLAAMLSDFFEAQVAIEEFRGQWMEIPEDCRWRLGESPETGCLGINTTVGERIWECQLKFCTTFGPVDYETYCRLLPGSDSHQRLRDLVRDYVGFESQCDLKLILRKEEIPPLVLGGEQRLGLTSWVTSRPALEDVADLVLPLLD